MEPITDRSTSLPLPGISVVVPVYNSAATLHALVERVGAVLLAEGMNYEIILVNDGSRDDSWRVLEDLQRADPAHIVAIDLMRNFGQHNALMCALTEARREFIVTIDDDLQNPPEEIPKLLSAIRASGDDLVYGRYEEKRHGGFRNFGSALTQWFYRRVFSRANGVSAFRILRHELARCVISYDLNYTYLDGLFAWNTNRISEILVRHDARSSGASGYSVARLLLLAINLFTNFSLAPLQIVSVAGLLTALTGFAGGAYFLAQRLLNNIEVPGFASVIIAVLMLGGVQMLSIGIMGEYLGRLHINVNRKPQYVKRMLRRAEQSVEDRLRSVR